MNVVLDLLFTAVSCFSGYSFRCRFFRGYNLNSISKSDEICSFNFGFIVKLVK